MTITELIDSVCDDLRGLFRGYTLPNKAGVMQEVRIFPQYIPQPSGISFTDRERAGLKNYTEDDFEKNFPGIVVKLGDVNDNEERRLMMNRTVIRLLAGVYDAGPLCEGWRDVLAMMEKIRLHWLKGRVISRRFRVNMPLTTRLLDDDTYPVYFGEMSAVLETGRPVSSLDYVYQSYLSNG